jgi:hypothetical protein
MSNRLLAKNLIYIRFLDFIPFKKTSNKFIGSPRLFCNRRIQIILPGEPLVALTCPLIIGP